MGLSDERKAQFSEAFELLGSKKSEVAKDVLADIMRSLGQNPTNDEVTAAFNKHSSGAGLTLDSLLTICGEFDTAMASQDQVAILKEAFGVFDKDKSGTISAAYASLTSNFSHSTLLSPVVPYPRLIFRRHCTLAVLPRELRHVIANIGEKVDEDELEEMMKDADKDNNGKIDYKEFVSVLLKPVDVPPQIVISPELQPFMDQVLQKEAKKHHGGAEAVEAS